VTMTKSNTMVLERDSATIQFCEPREEDGAYMWSLVKDSGVLDVNSSYSYLMMAKYFSETCVVAKEDDKMVGFVTAFKPPNDSDVIFVWQVGVDKSQRGKGMGKRILKALLDLEACQDVQYLEATISPSNKASDALFRSIARDFKAKCVVTECFSEEMFPGDNHEAEMKYRIGPLR
jgi:L-2,4-diaminobutyric acid acetyltransferase